MEKNSAVSESEIIYSKPQQPIYKGKKGHTTPKKKKKKRLTVNPKERLKG